MPAKSGPQFRLAAMVCHGGKAKRSSMSKAVACEMVRKTKPATRKQFATHLISGK